MDSSNVFTSAAGKTMPPRPRTARIVLLAAWPLACIIPATLQTRAGCAASLLSPQAAPAGRQGNAAMPSNASAAPPSKTQEMKSYSQTLPASVVNIEMVAVPAGTLAIAMGSGAKSVRVKPFWIANTETTWEAFDAFLASGKPAVAYDQTEYPPDAIARPSKSYILPDLGWGHHGYPVINVSFLSVTMFCRWLSAQTGKKYRLPTQTEWEYACRAGSPTTQPMPPAQAEKAAWFAANSDGKTHPVAKKQPNAWKLYDMQGNAGEWATDGEGKPVLCGGIFKDTLEGLLPTTRRRFSPEWQATDPQLPKSRWWLADGNFVGFRIVCEP